MTEAAPWGVSTTSELATSHLFLYVGRGKANDPPAVVVVPRTLSYTRFGYVFSSLSPRLTSSGSAWASMTVLQRGRLRQKLFKISH